MLIYVAAPFAARDLGLAVAAHLNSAGHQCSSTWLLSTRPITPTAVGSSPDTSDEDVMLHALGDLEDVRRADALLHLTAEWALAHGAPDLRLHSGGRHVEIGFALAHGKHIVSLGQPENIFQRGLTQQADSTAEAIVLLEQAERMRARAHAIGRLTAARFKMDSDPGLEALLE